MMTELANSAPPAKKRVVYFDLLNILACFCVVCQHTNSKFGNFQPTAGWLECAFTGVVCHWAVPVFFMLSGATLLKYRERYSTADFFKRRFSRILIPYIIWTVLLYFLDKQYQQAGSAIEMGEQIINHLLKADVMAPFWFFAPLFAIYLMMPVFSLLANKKYQKLLYYYIGICFVTKSVLPVADLFLHTNIAAACAPFFQLFNVYLMDVFLGYILSNVPISRKWRIIIYSFGILAFVLQFACVLAESFKNGKMSDPLSPYEYFPVTVVAVAVFVFFRYLPLQKLEKSKKASTAISKIASCSFGIYFMHVLIYRWILELDFVDVDQFIWRFPVRFAVYFICLAITAILKKIPVLKKIVP